ncbi:MAG: hypothetical protein NTU51_00680 [Bacteroidetes bacterium]|nr:hypothetical protein [Bacteroidota bacterium]
MRTAYFKRVFLPAALVCLLCFANNQSVNASTGDTLGLQFTENWDSASFTLHHWQFDPYQGNWQIATGFGNPAPSAEFSGTPAVSGYNTSLISTWFNGPDYACSDIWLSFDIRLSEASHTGNEKMSVEYCFYDTVWTTLTEFSNTAPINWSSHTLMLPHASSHFFKIRFRAHGINSSDISDWCIDNINLDYVCRKADHVFGLQHNNDLSFSWDPVINYNGYLKDFILDDNEPETAFRVPDTLGWMGNEFTLDPWIQGKLLHLEFYIYDCDDTSKQMNLDVFDKNHNIIWSSAPFTPHADTYYTFNADSLQFSGTFYGMLRWHNMQPANVYLGYDNNGPYTTQDPEWYFNNVSWQKLSALGYYPGAFMMRAFAWMNTEKKKMMIVPGSGPGELPDNSNRMSVDGYDVYVSSNGSGGTYNKLNNTILHTNTFEKQTNICSALNCFVYILTTFRDVATDTLICQSYSDTAWVGIEGTGNLNNTGQFTLGPNPANDYIIIHSDQILLKLEVLDTRGMKIKEFTPHVNEFRMEVGDIQPGLYLLKSQTATHSFCRKILISR